MVREQLKGKNIVITGASGGIGAEIAKLCAESGANLVLLARSVDKLEQLQIYLEEHHHRRVNVFKLDVSDTDQVKEVFEQIFEQIGHIDILVNNAGITRDKTFRKLNEEDWRKVIDVNLNSVFNTTNAVIPGMLEQKYGRIINISSIIGQAGGFGRPLRPLRRNRRDWRADVCL